MKYVDTPAGLGEALGEISRSQWAAVDTEADSLHHYSEKLSLIQVTAGQEDYVIDPLAGMDLAPFFSALSAKELLFHGADSDIRLIKKTLPFSPRKIFDTMIAAQCLGYERFGLADLAERHCGLRLSKAEQKADWSERPLDEKLIRYAANDTHYLGAIRSAMEAELTAGGRLKWHDQFCSRLLDTLETLKPAEQDRESAWQIKGSRDLKGTGLTVLRELWLWRDGLAREKDRPSFKILNSEYLVQLARWSEDHAGADVAEWETAPRNVKREYRQVLNELIRRAQAMPPAEIQPSVRKTPRVKWTEKENKILAVLKAEREKKAGALKVHPSLLATNSVLEALAVAKPADRAALSALKVMLPWQEEELGGEILSGLQKSAGN